MVSIFMRISILSHFYMHTGLEEIIFIYVLKLFVKGRFLFFINACSLQLILEFPSTTKGTFEVNVINFGNWSCDARQFLGGFPFIAVYYSKGVTFYLLCFHFLYCVSYPFFLFFFFFLFLFISLSEQGRFGQFSTNQGLLVRGQHVYHLAPVKGEGEECYITLFKQKNVDK